MSRSTCRLTLAAGAALVLSALGGVPPAAATSSCVAQSTLAEHQAHGSA